MAKTEGPARFASGSFLEPIRSDTWADAAADTTDGDRGDRSAQVRRPSKTISSSPTPSSGRERPWTTDLATFRAGLQIRSISYELDQFDRIQLDKRNQDESWMEWTPSLGVKLKLAGVDFVLGRITTGTGRPGTRWTDIRMAEAGADCALSSDFILAPSGPLTLQDARVTTHQLSVVIPMR